MTTKEDIEAHEEALKSIDDCLSRRSQTRKFLYCWDQHRKMRRMIFPGVVELKREVEAGLRRLRGEEEPMSDIGTKDDAMRLADVNELVSDAITAMRRAENITKTIQDREVRAQAEDIITNFWG